MNRKIKTPAGDEYRATRWGAGGLMQIQKKFGKRWHNAAAHVFYPEFADAILDRLAAGDTLNEAVKAAAVK